MINAAKLRGEKRRTYIMEQLKTSSQPLTGSTLAKQAGVSRQIIVQDIALLKALNEPIVATPQGYIYLSQPETENFRHIIAVQHSPEQTELELNILVDHGLSVLDVIVEHPFYGEIHGSLMVRNREDVRLFIKKWQNSSAHLLSTLTEGVHLHTVEANDETKIKKACQALTKAGILLSED